MKYPHGENPGQVQFPEQFSVFGRNQRISSLLMEMCDALNYLVIWYQKPKIQPFAVLRTLMPSSTDSRFLDFLRPQFFELISGQSAHSVKEHFSDCPSFLTLQMPEWEHPFPKRPITKFRPFSVRCPDGGEQMLVNDSYFSEGSLKVFDASL
jgi:hypothetical protein